MLAVVASALLLVGGAFAVGWVSSPTQSVPANDSAEAGFARDMQVHHQQAVELAMLVRDLTDDPAVRLLAYDIATSQAQQAGQMYGWLAAWRLPQAAPGPSMEWMTLPEIDMGSDPGMSGMSGMHDGTGATYTSGMAMPGYATADQIAELTALTGVAAEKEFLTLMIAHHEGGVEMAEALLARSTNAVVTDLAGSIVTAQSSEIELMTDMLSERE